MTVLSCTHASPGHVTAELVSVGLWEHLVMPDALIPLYIHNIRLSFSKHDSSQLTALPF